MKKITFMMSLLLSLGSMTASAQVLDRSGWKVTTSGECDDSNSGHASAIFDGNNNTYWHSNWGGGNGSGDNTSTLPQFFQVDLGSEQEFNTLAYMPRPGLSNGTVQNYKVYVSNNPFEKTGNGKSAADVVNGLTDAAAIESSFSYSGGTATLQTYKHTSMLKGRYVLFVVTGAKSDQADQGKYFASCAEFYLSKDADFVAKDITYHYMVNGEEYATTTLNTIDDGRIPNIPFLTNGEKTAIADGYNITCTESLPFTAQKNFDANTAHWYAMTLRGNDGNFLLSAKGGNAVGTTTVDKANHPNVLEDAYQWAFVGNLKDGFKLYSKTNNTPVTLSERLQLIEGEGTAFKLRANNNDGFGLFEIGKESNGCINRHADDKIATWTGFDDGSTIRIQEPKSYVIDYAAPLCDYDDNGAPEGAIGANSYLKDATNLAKFKEAYAAATANNATAEQVQALAEENVKVDAGKGETIVAGKYYRLVNAASSKTLYVTADNIMQTSNEVNKAVSSVVTFADAEAGRYRIKMQDKTFGKRVGDNQAITLENEDSGNKGSYKVVQVGTHFAFYDMVSNVSNRSYLHCNAGAANTLFTWDAGAINSPSRWFVIPATDVEIAMTAANDKHYASAYLPFAVVNEVNDAQAYVGELNDANNVLNMTAVNSVPANQGFVLVGNQEKATLTIGEAATLPIANNALTGSNVKVTLNDDNRADNLVFGKSSEGIVGFYKPATALTTIAANKAFIAASSLTTGAGAIAMNFGGNTTGINNAVVASENAPIFDLSGRRVVKAVKGGVYIQNGKKFVK